MKQKQDEKIKRPRRCCACKQIRKIVNIGGPPLCKDCYPLACNWSEALNKHHKFMRSMAGIIPLEINIEHDDDLKYWLEQVAEDLAEAKMKIKQSEICLINICTNLRSEHNKAYKFDVNKLPKEQLRFSPTGFDKIPKTKKK